MLPINNCIVPFERVYRAGALLSKFPARDLRKKGFAMSVRIITDSASDMSPAEHPALAVLPLSVTFGTDVYMDGIDIDHQRFYEMLVERDELPKTGQVNPYAFSQAIAEAREAGDEAVIITVGAKLSGTNQSARTALAEAPGGDVYVVDSNNVTLGERVLVEYALRLVDEGRSAAQIAAAVEAVRDLIRASIAKEQMRTPDEHVIGSLTMIYDHHTGDLTRRLDEVQHDYTDEIVSTMHVHLDHHNCLEILALKGRGERVYELADRLLGLRGVKHGELTCAATKQSLGL